MSENKQGRVFPEVFKLAKDNKWRKRVGKSKFKIIDAHITKDPYTPMLHVGFRSIGSIGFTLGDFPEDHWEWLLGSLSSQMSVLIEKAYRRGKKDAQIAMKDALGI